MSNIGWTCAEIRAKLPGGKEEYLIDKIVEYRSYQYSKTPPDPYPQEWKKIYRQQTGKELQLDHLQTCNERMRKWDLELLS